MENIIDDFHFYGAEDNYSSFHGEGLSGEVENWVNQAQFYGADDCGEVDTFWSDPWFYQQEHPFPGYDNFKENFCSDAATPAFQLCEEEIEKFMEVSAEKSLDDVPKQANSHPVSFPSLGLLSNFNSRFNLFTPDNERDFNGENGKETQKVGCRRLSTEEILRTGGAIFIQSSHKTGDSSITGQPYFSSFSNRSDKEREEIELAQNLLSSAEKVANQQFDSASKLLNLCDHPSLKHGTPLERVVYYFAEALREKINPKIRNFSSHMMQENDSFDIKDATTTGNSTNLVTYQGIPFPQVAYFAGIQAILEEVAKEKRIHIIDFAIRDGVHWTMLMQALAIRYEDPVQLLKISAVGTTSKSKIEKTGERLTSFADTLKLPFSFKIVMVQDMLELEDGHFEVESEEAVVVYLPFILRTMIAWPNRLDLLMKVVKDINARIMVVNEIEGSHNSSNFVKRFIESLFFFGAYFDCVEACIGSNQERSVIESNYFREAIRNIIANEGEHRIIRDVSIDVWRAFFARFGMRETELSISSLCQAKLVMEKFACGASCMLDMNKKSMILGWKGTPLHSLSIWKFRQEVTDD